MCFPVLSAPWKHIPRSYWDCPWGSRLWECVWERWVPYCVYQMRWNSLEMGQRLGVASHLLASEIQVWSKAITVRSKNTAIGWIFKELLGCTILWAIERKMWILPARSSAQLHTQDVSPQYPRIFQKDLGSLDFFYRDNVMEPNFGCWFYFPCTFGGLPYGHTFRGNCYWKTTFKQAVSISMWPLAHRTWESYVPSRKERP